MSMNGVGGRNVRADDLWFDVSRGLDTPAGRRRVRELIRSGLGVAALVFPSVRIVQAVLPLIEALLKALGFRLVPVEPGPPESQVQPWSLSDDEFAARVACKEMGISR